MRPTRSARAGLSLLFFAYALLSLLPLTAVGQTTGYSQKLLGNWFPNHLGNPNTAGLQYQFRHDAATGADEMIVSRACPGDNRAVTAKAVVPVEISEDTIHVLKHASDVEPAQAGAVCQISLEPGTLSYTASDDGSRITVTNPGGSPDLIELTRQDPASEPASPQTLYGTWLLPPLNSKEMVVQTRFVFYTTAERQEKVRQISVCTKGNESVVSQVDANITIGKDRITFMESVSHQQPANTFICTASIAAGTWRYTLAPGGVAITVSAEGGKPIKLTRESATGLN